MKKIKAFKISYVEGDFVWSCSEIIKGYCFTRRDALAISLEDSLENWGKGDIIEVELEMIDSENRYFHDGIEVTDKIRTDLNEIHDNFKQMISKKLSKEEIEYLSYENQKEIRD